MSFFKDFKDDLSLVVNELLPGEDMEAEDEMDESPEMMVNTLEGELDIESELSKLDGLLEHVEEKKTEMKRAEIESEEPVLEQLPEIEPEEPALEQLPELEPEPAVLPQPKEEPKPLEEPVLKEESGPAEFPVFPQAKAEPVELPLWKKEEPKPAEEVHFSFDAHELEPDPEPVPVPKPEPVMPSAIQNNRMMQTNARIKEELPMNEEMTKETTVSMEAELSAETPEITDEVSIITPGTNIKGNLATTGSFSINGRVEGNVQCNGKLEVTGTIKGNSSSSEVFSDAAKIEGEIVSTGTVKIGLGSVVVGNISATSAVIAGAVKGDIDVQGPVVVDTSAVIVGNIKSRSVQINNGAVIEGFCSQCYADIDVESLFGDNKKGR